MSLSGWLRGLRGSREDSPDLLDAPELAQSAEDHGDSGLAPSSPSAPDAGEADSADGEQRLSLHERLRRSRTTQIVRSPSPGEKRETRPIAPTSPSQIDKSQLKKLIHSVLMNTFKPDQVLDTSDPVIRQQMYQKIFETISQTYRLLSEEDVQQLTEEMMQTITGLGVLERFMADPEVTEIMVNGYRKILIERNGRIENSGVQFDSPEDLEHICERIAQFNHKPLNRTDAMLDGRLADGSRVNIIIDPLSLIGPVVTIRKFPRRWRMHELVERGMLTKEIADFLAACVRLRLNMIISGGTGSGKTSFTNALSDFIPDHLRVITIEDAPELTVEKENLVRLQTRRPNSEGIGEVTMQMLVKNALRMRPDIIIVGECRGGEALDMLQAMNTGHNGSFTTAHANSPYDLISRLETMVLFSGLDLPVAAIRRQIGSALELIIQIARFNDGSRRVTRLTEVLGYDEDRNRVRLRDLFVFEQEGVDKEGRILGEIRPCGVLPQFFPRFAASGIDVSPALFGCDEEGRPLPGVRLARGNVYA